MGDEKHDGYPALTHRPRQNGRLAAGRVGDTGTMVQHDEQSAHLLVHVTERKDGQEPVRGVAGDVLGYTLYVRCQVSVREHDALWVARRAGGEHDLGEIVRRDVHMLRLGQTLDGGFQLLEGNFGDPQVNLVLRSEPRRERQFRFCPGYDPGNVVGRAAKVQGDQYDSRPDTPEENEHPVGRVGSPQDDLVPHCQAPALEKGRDLSGLVPQP